MFLGFMAEGHDSSASLVGADGAVLAAVEEERFTRKKRDGRFPAHAIRCCLELAGIGAADVRGVAFPLHPGVMVFERALLSHLWRYPVTRATLMKDLRFVYRVLSIDKSLEREVGIVAPKVRYFRHHLAHAASAYYASPFEDAAYLTIDGRGELEAITWGRGRGAKLEQLGRVYFPHSIGKLYTAICRFLGFVKPEKDGTVMALAGCGEPRFLDQFNTILAIDPKRGLHGVTLATHLFDLRVKAFPTPALEAFLGVPMRKPDDPVEQVHRDIAASLQYVTQEAIMYLLRELHRLTGVSDVVMAGGVALNSVANGMILERTPFRRLFIQPASHDGGVSLGAALLLAHEGRREKGRSCMHSAALGPAYTDDQIGAAIDEHRGDRLRVERPGRLAEEVARLLADGKIVAVFNGRLEFGPRALGNRSILADPRDPGIQDRLNTIKAREPFRPFAVAVLHESASEWLTRGTESPFMLLVDYIRPHLRPLVPGAQHVDGTVRVQTVRAEADPFFYGIIRAFADLTRVPVVLNTSLNIKGEPLACTPADALRAFLASSIDAIAMGSYLVTRSDVPRPTADASLAGKRVHAG